jgi:hypothetical protein
MRQRRREATANDPNSPKVHRFENYLATVQIKPVLFSLSAVNLPSFISPATSGAADNGLSRYRG